MFSNLSASAQLLYENDLSSHSAVSGYDKNGNKALLLSNSELSEDIVTEIIDFSSGIITVEVDLFPKEISEEAIDIISIVDGTELSLISLMNSGVILLPEAENVFGAHSFVLDWYTLKIIIYNGEAIQLFLNNCETIPRTSVSLPSKSKFILNGCNNGNILLDAISIEKFAEPKIERVGFFKNDVQIFKHTKGKIHSGTVVYNCSDKAVNIAVIHVLYDYNSSPTETIVKEVTVLPGTSRNLYEDIFVTDSVSYISSFVWSGANLIPLLSAEYLK